MDTTQAEKEKAKKRLFKHLESQAEYSLEKLHQCTKDIHEFLIKAKSNEKSENFYIERLHGHGAGLEEAEYRDEFLKGKSEKLKKFRTKLEELTIVTKKNFKNLVSVLDNALEDVLSQARRSWPASCSK